MSLSHLAFYSLSSIQISLLLTLSPHEWTCPLAADWLQVCCAARSNPLSTVFLRNHLLNLSLFDNNPIQIKFTSSAVCVEYGYEMPLKCFDRL